MGVPPSTLADADTAPGFCVARTQKGEPAPLLCADFDDGSPLDLGWSATTLREGAELTREAGVLRATGPAGVRTGRKAALARPFAGPAVVVHYEARIRVLDLEGTAAPLALFQSTNGTYRGLLLYFDPAAGAYLQEETPGPDKLDITFYFFNPTFARGEWHTYSIDLTFGPTATSLELRVDGVTTFTKPRLVYPWVSDVFELQVGLINMLTDRKVTFEVDDVVASIR